MRSLIQSVGLSRSVGNHQADISTVGPFRPARIGADRPVESENRDGTAWKVGIGMAGQEWVRRQVRSLGFGRNPLRRGVDRIESMIVLIVVLAGLLMVPAGVALGGAVRGASEHAAAQRRAALTEVPARTLADSEQIPAGLGQVLSRVHVGWTDANGVVHEGWTLVSIGVRSGTDMTIWLDQSGAIVAPPSPPDDSAALGGAVGLTAVLAGWMLLAGLNRLALVPLNRRRSRDWEREWEQLDRRRRHPQS